MNSILDMNVGDRFSIKGYEHEITFVSPLEIRAARTAGGTVYTLSKDRFHSLQKEKQIKIIKQQNTDLLNPSNLSEDQIEERNRRLEYIRYVFDKTDFTRSSTIVKPLLREHAKLTEDKKKPGFSTFARWCKSYFESKNNPMSLVPSISLRGNRNKRLDYEIEKIILDRIEEDYLTEQKNSAKTVYGNIIGNIVEEFACSDSLPSGICIPSERTINRRIEALDPYIKSKKRHGKYVARKAFKAAGRSIHSERILQKVQADGNLLDVLIVDPDSGEVIGRPYGTILIDHYSRCIIAIVITMTPFSAATILQAMKLAVSKSYSSYGGLFETLSVDNGSDYISDSLKNFCNHLGIQLEYGSPRDPNSKPNVERFIGRLNTQLIHTIKGTTFESPTKRGDYDSTKYACMTLDDLNSTVKEWLDIFYHIELHRGHGRTPEALWNESKVKTPITHYQYQDVDQIARNVYTRTISGGRIKAFNLTWFSHALATIEHKMRINNQKPEVNVYVDTLNLDGVFIRSPEDDKVFIQADSTSPEYTSDLSLYEHNRIQEELKKKGKKDLNELDQYSLAIERWKFRQSLVVMGDKYATKQIARLKESAKLNNQDNPIIKELEEKSLTPESIKPDLNTHDESIHDTDDDDDDDYAVMEF